MWNRNRNLFDLGRLLKIGSGLKNEAAGSEAIGKGGTRLPRLRELLIG